MKNFLLIAALAALVGGCGAEWADCPTCKDGEESAQADDGEQIPVVVNVNVDVDVDQNQTQGQGQGQTQGQGQGQTQTNNPPVDAGSPPKPDAGVKPDAGTPPKPDAGTPPKPDAGVKPDAGTPRDAGCPPVCRKVCTCYETRFVCNDNRDVSKRSDCGSCGVKREYKKCTKEVTQCS